MSSIPNAKMKHAHVQDDAPPAKPKKAKQETLVERAKDLAEDAVEAVKDNPKTVAAIGAAVLAGAAALVGGPAIAKAVKGEAKKPAAKKAQARESGLVEIAASPRPWAGVQPSTNDIIRGPMDAGSRPA